MRNIVFILSMCLSISGFAQELNCSVVVNANQTGDESLPIFKTLEKQLNEFVNNTKWTNKTFGNQERIECNMVISVTEYVNNLFRATIQVQSSRPVFGSSYSTPLYNYNDKDFTFQYLEYQNLIFNPDQFESNLVSVLAFHIYMMFGLDADSFSQNGGAIHYDQAQKIVNYSQQENFKGWKIEDGLQTRYVLIDNVLSPTFKEFRSVMYSYHRKGLDIMSDNPKLAKEHISEAINEFKAMNNRRPNSFLLRIFFDAKSDEIEQIYSSGPSVNIVNTLETLNKIAPTYSSNWRNIKF